MLKNLKSLFIVDDSSEEEKTQKKPSAKEEKTKVSISSSTSSSTPPPIPKSTPKQFTTTNGVVDVKIVERLLQAIEKSNLEGFDYLEFKKSIKALEKIPMDEATKYRSAFATASTMGVTLDKLLETVQYYIKVLDNENTNFTNAFKGQLVEKVSGKEKEIVQFEKIIKEKSEKIKQLTAEITKHQQQIEGIKQKVAVSKQKIDKTQNDFKVSFNHLKSQFEADVTKMKEYLK